MGKFEELGSLNDFAEARGITAVEAFRDFTKTLVELRVELGVKSVATLAEAIPEDFKGRLNWVDVKMTTLIKQSIAEGKSPRYQGTNKPTNIAAAFSASKSKVIKLDDLIAPALPRKRRITTCPRVKTEGWYITHVIQKDDVNAEYIIRDPSLSLSLEPDPHSFRNLGDLDNEQAIEKLVDLLRAPDLKVVSFAGVA